MLAHPRLWKSGSLARVGMLPNCLCHRIYCVRRVFEDVVLPIRSTTLNRGNLFADRNERVTKPFKFRERFALCRFNHHCPRHRPRDGGGMKSIVHQPFGDIGYVNIRRFLKIANIDDALVRDAAILPCIEDRIVPHQPLRNVVGVENSHLCRRFQAICPHHGDIRPRNREDTGTSPRCG